MPLLRARLLAASLWLGGLAAARSVAAQEAAPLTPEMLAAFRFRSIGPAVTGGRIHDVEALPEDPATIYVATASGGLWKTVNKGTTWTPLFDGQPNSTFGDVAVAPSDSSVVWAGTGEQNNRQSTSWGDGVYRSTDGGRTWVHVGLTETRHIGRVLVHPTDPAVAWVAALGNLWKPSSERGVFKTTDGGRHWDRVLFVDTLTGVVDLVMDPTDPNTLYAAAYQRLRRTWGFNGGGPGSGIYKTTDGGRTWRLVSRGIPAGDKGRIGLAISRSDPKVLVALIEHPDSGGTFRSEDGGETWVRMSDVDPRPMYYSRVAIDPHNARRVYVLATEFSVSEDGGRSYRTLPTRPTYDVGVHSDFHAIWIDPNRTSHFYLAGDGGLYETWDRGATYEKLNNLPIAQFYAIGLDMRQPYYIYGGLQDNHSWMGPSATRHWIGIINDDWRQMGFGDGMYWQPDPREWRVVYGNAQNGEYHRVDPLTGDRLDVQPVPPAGEDDYRWDWVSPSLAAARRENTVYVGGNRLFISRDRGVTWERTPDLTRQIDRDTLTLMGVRGADIRISKHDGTASFGEIVTIAESPLDSDILWVGTDDGNVQLSRDGGQTWTEVGRNVRDVPDGTYVSRVLASRASLGTAWVTFDAHRDGDFRPYAFRTTDFGRTWRARTDGLPDDGSVNVIVEHPSNANVLFLGTEHALFASADAGRHWVPFRGGLPTTLYDDLAIHPRDGDLVVATHGRALWILDDAAPLAEWSGDIARADAHVFRIRPTMIFQYWKDTSYRGQAAYAGANPPDGAIITYYLRSGSAAATLTIQKRGGAVVRQLDVPAGAGLHRVSWDLRHEPPPGVGQGNGGASRAALPHDIGPRGPFVAPGAYVVTLNAGGARATGAVQVVGDTLLDLSDAQWEERERFLLQVADLQQRAWDAEQRARALEREAGGTARDSLAAARSALTRVRRQVASLAAVFNGSGVQQGSLYPPTATHRRRAASLTKDLEDGLARLEAASQGARGDP